VEPLVKYQTYIPEKKVWVSTVAYPFPIGVDRCAETMVFRGNESGITDWDDLYFESHGYETDPEVLKKKHDDIVRRIRSGEIKLPEEK